MSTQQAQGKLFKDFLPLQTSWCSVFSSFLIVTLSHNLGVLETYNKSGNLDLDHMADFHQALAPTALGINITVVKLVL